MGSASRARGFASHTGRIDSKARSLMTGPRIKSEASSNHQAAAEPRLPPCPSVEPTATRSFLAEP